MSTRLISTAGVVCLILACGSVRGAGKTAAASEKVDQDALALAAKIDQHIAKRWAQAKVEPAARADDAEFLRRVYLDIAGRIPSVYETRSFLSDKRPDKRSQLVEKLLSGPRYVTHMTNVYRALLLPEAGNNFQVKLQQGSFENWLRKQVVRNAPYNEMAGELLSAKVGGDGFPLAALVGDQGPLTYYLAKEFKPENLAASSARVFLGVSVECAQCHNHPFADWKREQFWGYAAFFSGIQSQRQMDFLLPGKEDVKKRELTIPGTDKVAKAKFLDGSEPNWKPEAGSRATLAEWMSSPSNPYFARASVNRTWAYFLGSGLIEPVDEMVGSASVASHPEVIDLLAKEFVKHKFDMKFLIRTITATRAYQLSSVASRSQSKVETALFARMPLRAMTGEQLFDSLALATGYRDSGGGDDLITGIVGGNRSARSEFLTKFALSERPSESQTSILQALSLMNGKVVADATSLEKSEILAAVLDAPFVTTAERIETLYIAALSRKPEKKEMERMTKFVQDAEKAKGKDEKARKTIYNNAIGDVFWVLLNSPEFVLNH